MGLSLTNVLLVGGFPAANQGNSFVLGTCACLFACLLACLRGCPLACLVACVLACLLA